MKKFAVLYGVWFALIFTGGAAASQWYKRHGADTTPTN